MIELKNAVMCAQVDMVAPSAVRDLGVRRIEPGTPIRDVRLIGKYPNLTEDDLAESHDVLYGYQWEFYAQRNGDWGLYRSFFKPE